MGPSGARWPETIPEHETQQIESLAEEMTRYQDRFAAQSDGRAARGFHVKSHAGLRAEFTVLENIPAEAQHGVFKPGQRYQAYVRVSNGFSAAQSDFFPDLLGFAVKLTNVGGLKLLTSEEEASTQDFLALNQRCVPARDARDLAIASMSAANILSAPMILIQRLGFKQAMEILCWALRWMPRRFLLASAVTEDFYSLSPIMLGPHAIKFMWRSMQQEGTAPRFGVLRRNRFREDIKRRLSECDLRYEFLVQFYMSLEKTPIDGAYAWNAESAPYVKLAVLTIGRRDLDSTDARTDETYLSGVSFNPWHSIAEHRPIGNIQRARRLIYQASAKHRGRQTEPIRQEQVGC